MRRFVRRAGLAALVFVNIGCTASPPRSARDEAQQCWERLSQRLQCSAGAERELPPQLARTGVRDCERLSLVAAKAADTVVSIETILAPEPAGVPASGAAHQTGTISGGTGVIIDADGLILTNAHVVRGAEQLTVILADGSRRQALQWAIDSRHDLAVVRISAGALPAMAARPKVPHAAASVIAVGRRAAGGACQTRCGVVSRVSASLQEKLCPSGHTRYDDLIESTAAIEPGFSGGPLLDSRGRWVGVNVAMFEAGRAGASRAYAIPLDDATCRRVGELVRRVQAR